MNLDTNVIDPASELVLIEQMDEHLWHQGGSIFFHPRDGFLYMTAGDEGGYVCIYDNCQRTDKDLFGGVLRIDVDMRGGNISHPITKQPQTGATANYYIPNDNPFVGVPGALEEFYALGLRSPHRMTYDDIDDITWIGEVGQVLTDELNVLRAGANYQWNALEGSRAGSIPVPTDPLGIWTDPVIEPERAYASSIIGGHVYRGAQLPYLYGKYVFGDYAWGTIFALSYAYDGDLAAPTELELLTVTPFSGARGITSFGIDRRGELYFMTMGAEAKIHRLARTDGYSNAPMQLSQTGVFRDTASRPLEASAGLIPYDVISPLWSDGARKQRWISVPDGRTVGFAPTGSWTFPQGTVLVKHFDLALDERDPDSLRRLETRVLVRGADDTYYGLTYKWNEAGTDASLVLESQREPINVTLADGQIRRLEYFYPGPNDCARCHSSAAGTVLGVRTLQLNHEMVFPETGRRSNQVYTWSHVGLLDTELDQAGIVALDSLVSPQDVRAPLEDRVRSYWAGNCSMCHGPSSDIRADWDARYEVPMKDQGVIDAPSQSATDPNAVLVRPGAPEDSVLYLRSSTTDRGYGMPPLGRSAADPVYVDLLVSWICSLSPTPTVSCPGVVEIEPSRSQYRARSHTEAHYRHRGFAWRKPHFQRKFH